MKILFLFLVLISSAFGQDSIECDYLRFMSFREFASGSSVTDYSKRQPNFEKISAAIDQEVQRSCRSGFKGNLEEGRISEFLQVNNWIRGCVGNDSLGNTSVLDVNCEKLLKDYLKMIRVYRAGRASSSNTNCTDNVSSTDRGIIKPSGLDQISNKTKASSAASPQ